MGDLAFGVVVGAGFRVARQGPTLRRLAAAVDGVATTTPTAATILAIDLRRYKSVACACHPATLTAAFRTLDTGRADFDRLVRAHPGVDGRRARRHRGPNEAPR